MKKETLRIIFDAKNIIKKDIDCLKAENETFAVIQAKEELKKVNKCIKWVKSLKK